MGFDDTGLGAAMAQSFAEGQAREAKDRVAVLERRVAILEELVRQIMLNNGVLYGRRP